MRGLLTAATLGLRRARVAPGRWLAVAVAVALAGGLLGALTASGVVAGDHAARRTARRGLPQAQRVAQLTWSGPARAAVDARARSTLGQMGARRAQRGVVLLETRVGRTVVRLGATEGIGRWVSLTSGRLPRGRCTAARCEVVAVDGPAAPVDVTGRGLRLVVVGSGRIVSAIPIGFRTSGPTTRPVRRASMLVSGDPAGLDRLAGVSSVSRTQTWSAPLDVASLHAWQIAPALRRMARVQQRLDATGSGFTAATPAVALEAALRRAVATPSRLRAVGATAAAVLLAFGLLAAGALRSGLLAEDGRLVRGGATAGQRAALALAETAVPVVLGLVGGLGLSVVAAAIRARAGGVSAGHVIGRTLSAAPLQLAAAGLVAWAATLLAARLPPRAARPLAALGLVAGVALLAGMLAPRSGRAGPLGAAVIPIAGATAGLLVGLAMPAVLRTAGRLAPRRRPLLRVALLELAREPAPAVVAAAGLAVAVGLGGFAFAYRSTLERSRADQAAQRVPLAAVVTPGDSLASPLRVRPAAAWLDTPGVSVVPVLRRNAFAAVGPDGTDVTLIGLPGGRPGGPWPGISSRSVTLPGAGARRPGTVSVRAASDVDVEVDAVLRRPADGVLDQVDLGTAQPRLRTLTRAIPAADRGGYVVALTLTAPSGLVATAGHQQAEGGPGGNVGAAAAHLEGLRMAGTPVPLASWTGHGAASRRAGALRLDFGEEIAGIVRPPTRTDHAPLGVTVDPGTARALGQRRFDIEYDGIDVPARIVAVAGRVPSVRVGSAFVLADTDALRDALDARSPGAGEVRELWLGSAAAGRLDAALPAVARRAGLTVRTRAGARASLDAEPVAREVLGALAVVALLAAVLAAVGVAVAIRRALRDGADALADLEAQGIGPAALRRGLRVRGAAIAVLGVVPGIGLAAALTALVTRAVRAGTGGAPPDPPLVTVVPVGAGLVAAAVLLVVAAALAALVTVSALRERAALPRTATEGA